jgi:hypothetical protein
LSDFGRYTVSVHLREHKFCIRLTCFNGNGVSTKIGQKIQNLFYEFFG